VRDLREEVVDDVRADVVVNLVEDAVVAVERGQAPAQIAPLVAPAQTAAVALRTRAYGNRCCSVCTRGTPRRPCSIQACRSPCSVLLRSAVCRHALHCAGRCMRGSAAQLQRCSAAPVPRHLLLGVRAAVVVQVRHDVEPHDVDPVRHHVQLEHGKRSELDGEHAEQSDHADHECVAREHHALLALLEEVARGVIVRAGLAGRSRDEVERVGEEGEGEGEPARALQGVLQARAAVAEFGAAPCAPTLRCNAIRAGSSAGWCVQTRQSDVRATAAEATMSSNWPWQSRCTWLAPKGCLPRARTMLLKVDFLVGYHDSSFSTSPWFAWCLRWLMRQPWYGTRIDACTMLPTRLFRNLLFENDWWPQSCPMTNSAQNMVPWQNQ
jgi:hypothetical protein